MHTLITVGGTGFETFDNFTPPKWCNKTIILQVVSEKYRAQNYFFLFLWLVEDDLCFHRWKNKSNIRTMM